MRVNYFLTLALFCSTLAAGQTALTVTPQKPTLDKQRVETFLRNLESFEPSYQVTIGDLKPSLFADYFEVPVLVKTPRMTASLRYFISRDGQRLVKGSILELGKSPFQEELAKLTTDLQPSFGSATAPVTIVEFADFQCPICKQEAKVLRQQLPAKYAGQVRVVFKDLPWETEHKWAKPAALAGHCIYRQNPAAFWDYHDWVYDHQEQFTPENFSEKLSEFSKSAALDADKLGRCISTRATEGEVERSVEEAHSLQVNRTPTLFINGREISGGVSWEAIEKVIQRELADKPKDVSAAPCAVASDGCSAWPPK
jgi:protein-disulfide isomerase